LGCSGWGGSSGSGLGSGIKGSRVVELGSLSAIRTKKREAQRCPHVNFSSQLKQSPCSRRLAISAGVRRFSGTGGGFGGVGNKGSGEGAGEGGERGKVGGGCDYDGVGRYSADKA